MGMMEKNNNNNEAETILRKRSFLYVVRHDLSLIWSDLHRLLELNEQYVKNGSPDWRWRRVIDHAGIAIRNLEERRNYIRRNLGEIRDLIKRDLPLEPESFVLQTVDPSRDVFGLASTITDPKFQQHERHDMASQASREIQDWIMRSSALMVWYAAATTNNDKDRLCQMADYGSVVEMTEPFVGLFVLDK